MRKNNPPTQKNQNYLVLVISIMAPCPSGPVLVSWLVLGWVEMSFVVNLNFLVGRR